MRKDRIAFIAGAMLLTASCSASRDVAPPPVTAPTVEEARHDPEVRATASFYGKDFAGKKTASGERFDPKAMTAAHRTLPFGTRVKFTNPANGKSVVVRINDRGPFAKGREYDLSHAAAAALEITDDGVSKLKVERLN